MADAYSESARDNILRASRGQQFPKVFQEWRVTGNLRDHAATVATCELCEQERLRYQFEISNDFTQQIMWVGSSCILKFGVPVFRDGLRVSGRAAARHLDELIIDFRTQACLSALRRLCSRETNQILENALDYFEEHNSLSPKFAFVVLWRLNAHLIDYSPSFFKINLKRQKFMRDLEEMPASRVRIIWPALSGAQRRRAIDSGVVPPR